MHSGDDPSSACSAAQGAAKPATVQQCHEVIEAQARQIEALRQRLTQQDQLLAELQERMKRNSRKSSKPPSSDGPGGARGGKHERGRSRRSRGAQRGHPGAYRQLLDEADVHSIHECAPPAHCECGAAVAVRGKPMRHQVFDVPPRVEAEVQEYRLYSGVCTACGREHRAALPAGVPSGQIGPRALALIGVLGTRYQLTQLKIRDLLAHTMGVDFSVGAISQAHGKVAAALHAPLAEAAATLGGAPVVYVDETRYPREGSANWVWGAIQPRLAVFKVLPSRARYVLHDLIGQAPQAVVVSDRYAAYAYLDAERRQVCWAHLLRDFNRIAQRQGHAGRIGRRLQALGWVMFRRREQGRLHGNGLEGLQRRVRAALAQGAQQTQCSRTANTCANVLALWPALWGFIAHAGVQPTNNAAEQALRSIVLKRKISGPTRSRRGDEFIAHGFSAYESCRRQGRDFVAYMRSAVVAWIDKTAHPSLLPAAPPSG